MIIKAVGYILKACVILINIFNFSDHCETNIYYGTCV